MRIDDLFASFQKLNRNLLKCRTQPEIDKQIEAWTKEIAKMPNGPQLLACIDFLEYEWKDSGRGFEYRKSIDKPGMVEIVPKAK